MNKENMTILSNYIKAEISPILLENVPEEILRTAVILKSDCDKEILNGHYEEMDFVAPNWYRSLIKISESRHSILIIENINEISKEEQMKFVEILKYKKISTFDLPKNCTIIVTCSNLKEKPINEEVYSLMAHIEG